MQKNTTHLFYALLCLAVAVPMLSGCRFNGAPYRPSSWEFYSVTSKDYFAPFASNESREASDYDDAALARQINDSPELPKTDIAAPRDGYLNSRETRVADNSGRKASDSYSDPLKKSEQSTSLTFGETARVQPAQNMFNQTSSTASQTPAHTYGTTSPVDTGFNPSNGTSQFASNQVQPDAYAANTPITYSATPQGGVTGVVSGTGMVAATSPNNQFSATPNDPVYTYGGQPTYQAAATTAAPQGQMGNPASSPVGSSPYNGMYSTNPTPQMVASNQGTGYVGQPLDYNLITPSQGMPVNGAPSTTQGTMTNPQGQTYPQGSPVTSGNAPLYQSSGMQNPSAAGVPNPNSSMMVPQNTQQPYGVQQQPYGTQQQPYYGQTYPAASTVNQANQVNSGGFSSFTATSDDSYRPGGNF